MKRKKKYKKYIPVLNKKALRQQIDAWYDAVVETHYRMQPKDTTPEPVLSPTIRTFLESLP